MSEGHKVAKNDGELKANEGTERVAEKSLKEEIGNPLPAKGPALENPRCSRLTRWTKQLSRMTPSQTPKIPKNPATELTW